MFIHIKPEETRTIERIPRALLFPAPGLPKGHVLMGYDDEGRCAMLIDGECSIYEYRPQTCRDYDCRVFAATGVPVDEKTQAEIANRVKAWVFDYESEGSREEHRMLKEAAALLQKKTGACSQRGACQAIPCNWPRLAVKIFRLFSGLRANKYNDAAATRDAAITRAILSTLSRLE